MEYLQQLDASLLLWLNDQNSPLFDKIMFFISGKWEWLPFYFLIIIFLARKYRWKSLWILLAIAVLIVMSDQLSNILKEGVKRPRPCKDPEIGHLVQLVNDYCRGSFGFISAHAANSFALASFLSLLLRDRRITIIMLSWALLVSYSRIYLGVHYPGDIIAGAIAGFLLAYIVFFFYNKIFVFADKTLNKNYTAGK